MSAFPGKKLALSKDVATTVINAKDAILADLQPLFESQYGHSFIDAVTRLPGSQLLTTTHNYKLSQLLWREKRKIQRVPNKSLTTNKLMLSLCLQKDRPCKATSDV